MSKFGPWSVGALAKATSQEEYDRILLTVPRKILGAGNKLSSFGYFYNENLELRQIANKEEKFAWLGQKHYDYLGESIVEYIYTAMEEKFGLQRIALPLADDSYSKNYRSTPEFPRTQIFVSPNWKTCENLVVICQGIGAVRAGMWARALVINNSLREGSIFTYLEWVLSHKNWGVLVMNPNENSFSPIAMTAASSSSGASKSESKKETQEEDSSISAAAASTTTENNKQEKLSKQDGDFWLSTPDSSWKTTLSKALREAPGIEHNEEQEDHGVYCWKNFVEKSDAASVMIVAHSYGGRVTTAIIDQCFSSVKSKVACIAWTDAVNDNMRNAEEGEVGAKRNYLRKKSRNYVGSDFKVGTPTTRGEGYEEVSAGHKTHEWTSYSCGPHLWKWCESKLSEFLAEMKGDEKKEEKKKEENSSSSSFANANNADAAASS